MQKRKDPVNNIFGVDLDANAVEVTKLSLLIKCLKEKLKHLLSSILRFGTREYYQH
jgi:hypothetical protein